MKTILATIVLGSALSLAAAQEVREAAAPRNAIAHYNLEKSVALSGYDPVAYFAGDPAEGKSSIETSYRGVTYRFANQKTRELFLGMPDRFEPAYGGWCAYAMAKTGDKVEIDPESYLIENGQLLVFYKGFLNNTRKKWGKEGGAKLGPKADTAWQKISGEKPAPSVRHLNLSAGVDLDGFDPVSYRSGSPAKGSARLALVHEGVTYHFANEANKASFEGDPASYTANYGGWCAWAMAQGKKVQVDPKSFTLEGKALHLFYNNAKRDEWKADRVLKPKADAAWAQFVR